MKRGKDSVRWVLAAILLIGEFGYGATATFTPIGPTVVAPGVLVRFEVVLTTTAMAGFSAADVIIGSDEATNITFAYSTAWTSTFQNVTAVIPDVFYPQDVFVGGNNPTSVGTTITLGTVTVDTRGMSAGTYRVRVDPAVDHGFSRLSLGDARDPIVGVATFDVECPLGDAECDGDLDLVDYREFRTCVAGPDVSLEGQCLADDFNGDGDVDLEDTAQFANLFTGAR
ncbi:MAG: hypothetical protein AABZ47_15665 [Planctomycetota bacterium]